MGYFWVNAGSGTELDDTHTMPKLPKREDEEAWIEGAVDALRTSLTRTTG